MSVRDEIEAVLRGWDAYEIGHGGAAVIDYDCFPGGPGPEGMANRLAVYRRLAGLRAGVSGVSGDAGTSRVLTERLDADLAYLGALLGERLELGDYVQRTQGCPAAGWPEDYIAWRGELARQAVGELGIGWGNSTNAELRRVEGPVDAADAADAIRQAADELESAIREATGSNAKFSLTIETTEADVYWAYWLDGVGQDARLRLNLSSAEFTQVSVRQFALHEVLGHALQNASFHATAVSAEVPWVRLASVHTPYQVLSEGLAQAWPLFVLPDDEVLTARVRVDHYLQLVRGQVHRAINDGWSVLECAEYQAACVPWWDEQRIGAQIADRGADPQLRSYLWAYVAGMEWFVSLAEARPDVTGEILRAAYRRPLSPADLARLWPEGPAIGGAGGAVRLRKPSVS